MAGPCTVDASVFLNAFNPTEAGHKDSNRLMARMKELATPIIVPTLVLPEVAATISRVLHDSALAAAFAKNLQRLPNLMLVALDIMLAEQAADMAAQRRLRGSDSVYAAVALRFGSTLVTLDREQRERLATVISSRSPTEMMAELGKQH
ncbi:MAG TPA: type II toxin-antitoxin system VapC family toxin [Acidobacteriota bacterium]|jgi:predicted nucleic acid-binding protein|nr:type II toxin-antitoxin system VapC family toxin [Acidobacteriota bacterium]